MNKTFAEIQKESAEEYQSLFDFFAENHDLVLTVGEMDDVINAVKEHVEQRQETASAVDTIVSGSLPDDENIEDEALNYIEDQVYISTGEGHDTCREWAFVAGAKWMREQIGNDH